MRRLLGVVAMIVVFVAADVAGAVAATLPPGQASAESYEVFPAIPSATVGAIDQDIEFLSTEGEAATLSVPGLGESLLDWDQINGVGPPSVHGFVVTSSAVAAVSVDGGAPIPTVASAGLYSGLRSAAYEIPGTRLPPVTTGRARVRPLVTPLGAEGQPITAPTPIKPKAALEIRSWEAPGRPSSGVCEISARRSSGFAAQSGGVVAVIRPVVSTPLPPYVTCAETTYSIPSPEGTAEELSAFVVLDAGDPGATPDAMAALEPMLGVARVFQSRVPPSGEVVARRIPGAWLLVEGGANTEQRVRLLDRLSASVHMPPKRQRHSRSRARG